MAVRFTFPAFRLESKPPSVRSVHGVDQQKCESREHDAGDQFDDDGLSPEVDVLKQVAVPEIRVEMCDDFTVDLTPDMILLRVRCILESKIRRYGLIRIRIRIISYLS